MVSSLEEGAVFQGENTVLHRSESNGGASKDQPSLLEDRVHFRRNLGLVKVTGGRDVLEGSGLLFLVEASPLLISWR